MSGPISTRGEISVSLEGAEYTMRPSYEAQVAIERATGRTVMQLAEAAGANSLTIEQAAVVITECCRAQGRATGEQSLTEFNARRIGELLVEEGMLQVGARLELLLFLASTGGFKSSGELKAQMINPATPAAV